MGHNRDAVMVPFYPRHFQSWYFTDSRGLGYDYDNFNYGKSGKVKFVESQNSKLIINQYNRLIINYMNLDLYFKDLY